MKRFASLALLGALGLAVYAAPAQAAEAVSPSLATALDAKPAEFTASPAKMRRMQIIQHNMARQRRYEGRGRGRYYGGGPRYGRPAGPPPGYYRRGYGNPPPGYYR